MIYQPVNITCKNTVLEPHNLAAFLNVAEPLEKGGALHLNKLESLHPRMPFAKVG